MDFNPTRCVCSSQGCDAAGTGTLFSRPGALWYFQEFQKLSWSIILLESCLAGRNSIGVFAGSSAAKPTATEYRPSVLAPCSTLEVEEVSRGAWRGPAILPAAARPSYAAT